MFCVRIAQEKKRTTEKKKYQQKLRSFSPDFVDVHIEPQAKTLES